jgi:hypothetical protein
MAADIISLHSASKQYHSRLAENIIGVANIIKKVAIAKDDCNLFQLYLPSGK